MPTCGTRAWLIAGVWGCVREGNEVCKRGMRFVGEGDEMFDDI